MQTLVQLPKERRVLHSRLSSSSPARAFRVSADVLELMAPEKRKTLLFKPSVVSQSMIDFYISKGYFAEGVCRPPGAEVIHVQETARGCGF